ncbi:MAG: cytochrome c peroxidase, partial [Burkholderiaceae bacterium]
MTTNFPQASRILGRSPALWPAVCFTLILAGCGGGGDSAATAATAGELSSSAGQLSAAAAIGEQLFADRTRSAAGNQSCAACHDPATAHPQT